MAKKITREVLEKYLHKVSYNQEDLSTDISEIVQFLIDMGLLNLDLVEVSEECGGDHGE